MLAVSDVIQNERFARLYARVLELNTPTVEELASRSASSQTTVYEDVKHLVEIGVQLFRAVNAFAWRFRLCIQFSVSRTM